MKSKVLFLMVFVLFLASCHDRLTDDTIKEQIHLYYQKISAAVGGGSWHVQEINIIDKVQVEKNHWKVKTVTTGWYESPPLGTPVPDEVFMDTLKFNFRLNRSSKWMCDELYPPE